MKASRMIEALKAAIKEYGIWFWYWVVVGPIWVIGITMSAAIAFNGGSLELFGITFVSR